MTSIVVKESIINNAASNNNIIPHAGDPPKHIMAAIKATSPQIKDFGFNEKFELTDEI